MQALHADGLEGVGRFYGALISGGVAAYNAGRPPFAELEGTVLAAGLPPAYAAAADDAAWDEGIRRSMAEAFAAVGEGVGTPALVLHRDPPVGVLGPLVSPPPTGADAVRLWDAVAALAGVPGVLEVSRPRPRRPMVPGLRW